MRIKGNSFLVQYSNCCFYISPEPKKARAKDECGEEVCPGEDVCPEGFWGLGDSCFDLDECGHPNFNECKDGTTCHNHEGGYSCVCPNGLEASSNGDCFNGKMLQQIIIIYIIYI